MSDQKLCDDLEKITSVFDIKEPTSEKEDLHSSCVDSGFLSGPLLTESGEESEQSKLDQSRILQNTGTNNFDSGLCNSSDTELTPDQKASKIATNPMKLKNDLSQDLSEWFCDLSLNSNQPVNDLNINRLSTINYFQRVKESFPASDCQANSWEEYYQQNNDGDTQLHLAIICGFVNVAFALIRITPHPCLLNIRNDDALSPLHLAVLTGQTSIVRRLLLAGADATIRDATGNTPLHTACICGDTDMVKVLTSSLDVSGPRETTFKQFSSQSNLEIRNFEGKRCIHIAAEQGHVEILRHLVSCGVDINSREGKSGKTALHIAIENRSENMINVLLRECEALNLEQPNYAGLTAYQLAAIAHYEQILTTLKKCGAEPLTPPESDEDSDFEDCQMYSRYGEANFFNSFSGGKTIHVV